MSEKSYRWLFWGLAILGVASDQVSKYAVFHQLFAVTDHRVALIPRMFTLNASYDVDPAKAHYSEPWRKSLQSIDDEPPPYVNRGALFGWFHDQDWGNAFFAIVSVAARSATSTIAWCSSACVIFWTSTCRTGTGQRSTSPTAAWCRVPVCCSCRPSSARCRRNSQPPWRPLPRQRALEPPAA
jgi:hypothetical protein